MTASSERCMSPPHFGRLLFPGACLSAWCSKPQSEDKYPWLIVDLGTEYYVLFVATQGSNSEQNEDFVFKYRLKYDIHHPYRENGMIKVPLAKVIKKYMNLCWFTMKKPAKLRKGSITLKTVTYLLKPDHASKYMFSSPFSSAIHLNKTCFALTVANNDCNNFPALILQWINTTFVLISWYSTSNGVKEISNPIGLHTAAMLSPERLKTLVFAHWNSFPNISTLGSGYKNYCL